MSAIPVRKSVPALAVVAVVSLLAGCGSGKVKNAASTASGAAKEQLAAATTTTTTETVTEPAKTVTQPARTQTVTRTETTTVQGRTTTVQVSPTTTTSGDQSSGGVPAWGWVLIGAGAVLLLVAIFMLGHNRGARRRDAGGPGGPAGRPPDATMPPRGPPQDPI